MNDFIQKQLKTGDAILIGKEIYWKNRETLKEYHNSLNNNKYVILEEGCYITNQKRCYMILSCLEETDYSIIHFIVQKIKNVICMIFLRV